MTQQINRRRRAVLTSMTALFGSSIASQLLDRNGLLVATAFAESSEISKAMIFSSRQLIVLKQICQVVIPKTDTEGAGDIDTHRFIDNQLYHCFTNIEQQLVAALISNIDKSAIDQFQQGFAELPSSKATQLLSAIDSGDNKTDDLKTLDFKFLKSLIVFGYYTSEIGASKELRYDSVPGGFKAQIPLREIGSAWGSNAFF